MMKTEVKTMTKSELAVYKHSQGYNCAQAVACAFAEEVGVDEALLYRMCEGFGAGMGNGQGVCGALSGAAVIAGLMNSDGNIGRAGGTKVSTYKLVSPIHSAFRDKVGSTICSEIKAGVNTALPTSCPDCIAAATQLVEETFFNADNEPVYKIK